ncbi:PCI domain-containing protein, putative, partial [Plasmodium ovale curtisi]
MSLRDREGKVCKPGNNSCEQKKKNKIKTIPLITNLAKNNETNEKMSNVLCTNKVDENILDTKKKHYLDNVDKTLLKNDINCISYAYKRLSYKNAPKKIGRYDYDGNGKDRCDSVLELMSIDKKKRKNLKARAHHGGSDGGKGGDSDDDKSIQSLIYDTFVNKNLKVRTGLPPSASDYVKMKNALKTRAKDVNRRVGMTNRNGKGGNGGKGDKYVGGLSSCVQREGNSLRRTVSNRYNKYAHNLTAETTEKEHAEACSQITETNEELNSVHNDSTFLYEKIRLERENKKNNVSTQTSVQYEEEELKRFAKYLSKKVMNEAIIQITYDQNVKQIDIKKTKICINDQANKKTYSRLVGYQEDNLCVLNKRGEVSLSNYLGIFNKINVFSCSRNIINSLTRQNVAYVQERNAQKKAEEIELKNDIARILLKNTIAFLATEKIVSFIAEELVEESLLSKCMLSRKDALIISRNVHDEIISKYERRKMERGHFLFVLTNGKPRGSRRQSTYHTSTTKQPTASSLGRESPHEYPPSSEGQHEPRGRFEKNKSSSQPDEVQVLVAFCFPARANQVLRCRRMNLGEEHPITRKVNCLRERSKEQSEGWGNVFENYDILLDTVEECVNERNGYKLSKALKLTQIPVDINIIDELNESEIRNKIRKKNCLKSYEQLIIDHFNIIKIVCNKYSINWDILLSTSCKFLTTYIQLYCTNLWLLPYLLCICSFLNSISTLGDNNNNIINGNKNDIFNEENEDINNKNKYTIEVLNSIRGKIGIVKGDVEKHGAFIILMLQSIKLCIRLNNMQITSSFLKIINSTEINYIYIPVFFIVLFKYQLGKLYLHKEEYEKAEKEFIWAFTNSKKNKIDLRKKILE